MLPKKYLFSEECNQDSICDVSAISHDGEFINNTSPPEDVHDDSQVLPEFCDSPDDVEFDKNFGKEK